MGCLWKKCIGNYESSAKIVDGNLILSLPDALNPVVWRMELGNVKTSALEVRAVANDETFMLALKTPKGDVHDIAPFGSREKAVSALMCVSNAMQNAHGRMSAPVIPMPSFAANAQAFVNPKQGSPAYKWLFALGGVLLVILLFSYIGSIAPRSADIEITNTNGTEAEGESGVPQSANQILKGF